MLSPVVIDAFRSWAANLTAVCASLFAMFITLLMYYGSWSAETEVLRITFLLVALVLTHAEVLFGIFYLHRIAMRSLELKGPSGIELEVTTHDVPLVAKVTTETVGSTPKITISSEEGDPTNEPRLHGSRRRPYPRKTKRVVRTGSDQTGGQGDMDFNV